MILSRRNFLTLLAAPAIVRASSLMPVRAPKIPLMEVLGAINFGGIDRTPQNCWATLTYDYDAITGVSVTNAGRGYVGAPSVAQIRDALFPGVTVYDIHAKDTPNET